jgi:hypothetical protein
MLAQVPGGAGAVEGRLRVQQQRELGAGDLGLRGILLAH